MFPMNNGKPVFAPLGTHNFGSFLASTKVSSGAPASFVDHAQICLTQIRYHGLKSEPEEIYILRISIYSFLPIYKASFLSCLQQKINMK